MEALLNGETVKRRTRRDSGPGSRPHRRNGQFFNCPYCGDEFYRRASFIARGITKTCGKRECISKSMQKAGNPFWGKSHSDEVRIALSEARTATPPKKEWKFGRGRQPGSKDGPEARARKAERMRKRWSENRDVMLAYVQAAPKPREEQRYRRNFTPWQRLNWKADKCAWCSSTEDLILDHVIPVMDDGFNVKENSQTLCQPCNMWKSIYVDRPSHLARLALQGGLVKG